MQILLKPSSCGRAGCFETRLGQLLGFLDGEHRTEGEFLAEIGSDEVFEEGRNLSVLDDPKPASFFVLGDANVLTGIVSECFDNQTAVLMMGDGQLIFEYSGVLRPEICIVLKVGPFRIYPVLI